MYINELPVNLEYRGRYTVCTSEIKIFKCFLYIFISCFDLNNKDKHSPLTPACH